MYLINSSLKISFSTYRVNLEKCSNSLVTSCLLSFEFSFTLLFNAVANSGRKVVGSSIFAGHGCRALRITSELTFSLTIFLLQKYIFKNSICKTFNIFNCNSWYCNSITLHLLGAGGVSIKGLYRIRNYD